MPCRCLLAEAGEYQLAENIREYTENLGEDIKAESSLYQKRLKICEKCSDLLNGTCLKCGCYVEMRAAVKHNRCPSEEKYW
ncbi:MAG: DUF6171 family protein [Firmicutes bacterium]|nr:DUF6171 family protein [Bacillota bacterium]